MPRPLTTLALLLLCQLTIPSHAETPTPSPNVLFIAVDDLRPALGCYGNKVVKSPNIDRLAAEGRRFNRHYVSSAVCVPSRSAMLSGRHYGSNWPAYRKMKTEPKTPVSFPHLFRKNGYHTVCIGKISHLPGGVTEPTQTTHEIAFSWDRAYAPIGKWKDPWGAFFAYADGSVREYGYGRNKTDTPAYEMADVPDEGYPDGLNAAEAVKQLRDLKKRNQPFLLAVGFYKPHLPFNAPKKYWDLYDPAEIPSPPSPRPPKGIDPAISMHRSFEVTTHYDWPGGEGNISDEEARTLRHAYYACVSYTDAQIGKVLDELARLRLDQNTIVILWGDHGWHLGDHGMFGKQTNFEIATRSPMIIKTPGLINPGQATDALAQTIDLYPTLADLCGFTPPDTIQGTSLIPLLDNPAASVRKSAYSFFKNGKTLRTDRHRIVKWTDTKTNEVLQIELYDHENDPHETVNITANPENKDLVSRLLSLLARSNQ